MTKPIDKNVTTLDYLKALIEEADETINKLYAENAALRATRHNNIAMMDEHVKKLQAESAALRERAEKAEAENKHLTRELLGRHNHSAGSYSCPICED